MKKWLDVVLVMVFTLSHVNLVVSQDATNENILQSINGPKGNYIFIINMSHGDSINSLELAEYFIVDRMEFNDSISVGNNENYQNIGECKIIESIQDLRQNFDDEDLTFLQNFFRTDNEGVLDVIRRRNLKDLTFLYPNVKTRLALGHIYLDEKVQDGKVYKYRIRRVDSSNNLSEWGVSYAKTGVGNYVLNDLVAQEESSTGIDSSIFIQWKVDISTSLVEGIPKPLYSDNESINNFLLKLPFELDELIARVLCDTGKGFIEEELIMGGINKSRDSLIFNYEKRGLAEDWCRCKISINDAVFNQGKYSETSTVFAIDQSMVSLIYGIEVTDTLNGIFIEWDQLPYKPYYSGIELIRYDKDNNIDTLAVLEPTQNNYLDRQVSTGEIYRYYVRALFLPETKIIQKIPAEGVGTYKKFTKPLPPFNLTAENIEGKVQLKWESVDENSVFGYYLYRGTSPYNCQLVDGVIKENSYLDTDESLSGRNHYFYKVLSENLRQDTSDFSNIVSIRPNKKIEIKAPETVNIYYANGSLYLDWRDVRKDDNIIDAFVLQRKSSEESEYTTIHENDMLMKPSYKDEDIIAGETYYYRVASKSLYGDLSSFSLASEYYVKQDRVATVDNFNIRNISEGIKISLPQMDVSNRTSVNIYKRNALDSELELIQTLEKGEYDFVDINVINGEYYVYKLTVKSNNGVEGPKGKSKTLKRD